MNILNELTFMGLTTDIAGGVFISKSVFFKKNQDIFDTSAGYLGYSAVKSEEAITAKREALFGCFLLILGFGGQFGGAIEEEKLEWVFILLYGLALCVICIVINYCIKLWSKKTVAKMVEKYHEKISNINTITKLP